MGLLQSLKQVDVYVFYWINKRLHVPSLDALMLLMRQAYTWIPLYLFMLLFFYFNTKKHFFKIIAVTAITFALTDFVSASILKPFIERLRPCYDPTITFEINNLPGCGGVYSMPSSHASNHFGLASLWFMIIKKLLDRKWYWLWVWAFIIGYSQVYVGVHFPGDILVGGILGIVTANFSFFLFEKWIAEPTGNLIGH
jgi:undecaprenyl-diphosphatase